MSSTPILTLSPGVPFALAAELLTQIEAVLERYGAQRVRIDPASRLTTVLADLPPELVLVPVAISDIDVDIDGPGALQDRVAPIF